MFPSSEIGSDSKDGSRFKVFIHHKYYYIVHNTFINLYNYSKNGEEVHIETIKAY